MSELKRMFIRQRKYIFFLLSAYVLGWGFTCTTIYFFRTYPWYKLKLFNLWIMVERPINLVKYVNGGKIRSLGLFSRMATAVFAVMIAMKYPEYSILFLLFWD